MICSTNSNLFNTFVYQIDQQIANPGCQNQWFVQQNLVDVLSNKRTNEQITNRPGFISFVKLMRFVVLSNKWANEQTTNSGRRSAFHVVGGRRGAPRVRGDAPRLRRGAPRVRRGAPRVRRLRKPMVSQRFARFVTCPRSHRDRAKSSQRRAKSSRRYTKSPQGRAKGSQKRVKSSQDAQTYGFRMLHLLIC